MSSVSANPFELKPRATASPVQPMLSNSRAFGAAKMARFIYGMPADNWDSASFDNSSALPPRPKQTLQTQDKNILQDTQAGLLQTLSSPALKRDAVPLASEAWLPNAPVYDDPEMALNTPWQQIKDKLLDVFFEPMSVEAQPVNQMPTRSTPQQERPIGIAQLSRVSSAVPSRMPEKSPIERLKRSH